MLHQQHTSFIIHSGELFSEQLAYGANEDRVIDSNMLAMSFAVFQGSMVTVTNLNLG